MYTGRLAHARTFFKKTPKFFAARAAARWPKIAATGELRDHCRSIMKAGNDENAKKATNQTAEQVPVC